MYVLLQQQQRKKGVIIWCWAICTAHSGAAFTTQRWFLVLRDLRALLACVFWCVWETGPQGGAWQAPPPSRGASRPAQRPAARHPLPTACVGLWGWACDSAPALG
jgi:hypothetical protein